MNHLLLLLLSGHSSDSVMNIMIKAEDKSSMCVRARVCKPYCSVQTAAFSSENTTNAFSFLVHPKDPSGH